MLARFFVVIGGLIVLLLMAALIGPYFIDWTSYRAGFEREAGRILGRTVKVEGDARARLLPFPSIAFTDVRVAGRNAGESWLTIDAFSMDMELAPLLRGEILIVDMRVERPQMLLSIDESGRMDWTLDPNLRVDPAQVGIERITISEGEVRLRHVRGGREHVLGNLDASLAAKSLAGPWRMEGRLEFDGMPLRLAGSSGAIADDGAMSLRMQMRPVNSQALLETEGALSFADGIRYAGNFRLLREMAEKVNQEAEPFSFSVEAPHEADALDYRVSGSFAIDHRQIEIDRFRFETGPADHPYAAEGDAFLDLGMEPHFTIELQGQQVRLDETAPASGARPLERRLGELQAMLKAVPHPSIPGTVRFDLPALVAGETTIREISLAAEPVSEGWRIRRFSAQMPGRTTMEASGILSLGLLPAFDGSLLLAIAQPSGFAAWLSDEVDDAIRRLPSAGFSANVSISARRQNFRELELILGGARFRGEVDHHVPGDARPSMLLRLQGGQLDVDGLLAFASLFVDEKGAARLAGHDLDLELQAGPVLAGGLRAERIDTALRIKQGELEIDRLSIAELAGATISATGSIQNLPHRPSGTLDAAVLATDLAPLARKLAVLLPNEAIADALERRLGLDADLLRDANLELVISAAANSDGTTGLAVSAHGVAGGSTFTAAGSAVGDEGSLAGPVSLSLAVQNENAGRLLAAIGLPVLPVGPARPGELELDLRGDPQGRMKLEAALTGDDLLSGFDGHLILEEGEWVLEGGARLEAEDLEPWLAMAGFASPGFGWGLPAELSGQIRLAGDRIELAGMEGRIDQAGMSGQLTLALDAAVPGISGEIALGELDLGPLFAMLLGAESLPSAGEGWQEQPFANRGTLPLSGEVRVSADRLATGFGPEMRDARMDLAVRPNRLQLKQLAARAGRGQLRGEMELVNDGGTSLLATQFQWEDLALALDGKGIGMTARASLSASLTASGGTAGELLASLSGSGAAEARDLVLRGLDAGALEGILRLSDRHHRDFNEEMAAELAIDHLRLGSFEAEPARLAFTVAGGMARIPTVVLRHPQADLETAFSVNLREGTIRGDAELTYHAGNEAVIGAEPSIRLRVGGQALAPEIGFDAVPLARYLTQRALELEQLRVEAMQERLLERQRLRRELGYYSDSQIEGKEAALPQGAPEVGSPLATEELLPVAAEEMPAVPDIKVPVEEATEEVEMEMREDAAGQANPTLLPEVTNVIPVQREDMPPLRLTPPAPPAAAPLPPPPPSARRQAQPEPSAGFFDRLFQRY